MKESIPQSHIYPKASFVMRSFRPILWSYSAYVCPLSRRQSKKMFDCYYSSDWKQMHEMSKKKNTRALLHPIFH